MFRRSILRWATAALTWASIVGSAGAQAISSPHVLALAAGYKAAFLCSDIFTAGEGEEQATADDLEGAYKLYQNDIRTLPAIIDRDAKTVSVAFDARLPPRIAAWRPGLGCAQLPIGAGRLAIGALPVLKIAASRPDLDAKAWPGGDANAVDASSALEPIVARAFDGASFGAGARTTAVVVVRGGRIIAERYRDGFDLHRPQRTWSAAKSITASVIGRAVQLRLVEPEAPVGVPEWRNPGDPRSAITLAQLLHMNSGLFTNGPGSRTDEIYVGGGAVNQVVTSMPLEAQPGSRFRYANDDVLLAARALRARLGDGDEALDFPYRELLWRIGMTHTTLETDWRGNYVLSSQVWTTARDLARLGLLYLNDGVWNGERLLPEGWARYVARPSGAQPPDGPGYGALFWLFGPAQGLPEGTYAMLGNRGQYVFIIPRRDVIIVRRGYDPAEGGPQFDAAGFARAVLAAAP